MQNTLSLSWIPKSHPIISSSLKSSLLLFKSGLGMDETPQTSLDLKIYELEDKSYDLHKLDMQCWDKDSKI